MSDYTALIIDDNDQNIEVLQNLLIAEGVATTTINDPRLAEVIAAQMGHLDLIFCDLEMPNLDGFTLLRRLRARVRPETKIIAYTVHVSEMDVARQSGFDGFLGKPLDGERFGEQLRRILNGQPVWERP
jgi:two-component system cell cycle response regulator DivK